MSALEEVVTLLRSFVNGGLDADAFVRQYSEQWRSYRETQYRAIAAHPTVSERIGVLQAQLQRGDIAADEFARGMSEQWSQLHELEIRPGTRTSEVLDHLFVESDAYISDTDERDTDAYPPGLFVTGEELRAEARAALAHLTAGPSSETAQEGPG